VLGAGVIIMANRVLCESCGGPIEFEEWERGTDVYCPTCGRPSQVPVLDETAGSEPASTKNDEGTIHSEARSGPRRSGVAVREPSPAPEVFGDRSDLAIASRVIEERACPRCHAKVPISINDHGGSTYCPACGAEIPVGEALVIRAAPSAVVALPRAPKPTPAPTRRSRAGLVAVALIALTGTLWLVRQSPRSAPTPVDPRVGTPKPPPKPDAHVTLKAIEELGKMPQPGEALAQAEDWKELLVNLKVPATDPRMVKLEATIALLRDKVIPESQPDPPEVAEFLEQVRALTQAMKSLQNTTRPDAPGLTAGRAAMTRANELLAQHPEVLDKIAATFHQMSAEFRKTAARLEGIRPIEGLLKTAREHVDADRPTDALETLAMARLLTLATYLDDTQRKGLANLHDAIINGSLHFSLCRRSLTQAEQAMHTGDAHAREWLADDAQSHLNLATSRAPDKDCAALVARLKALKDAPPAGPGRSSRVPEFMARRAYEKAIESFATWGIHDASRWIECARDFDEVARMPSSKPVWVGRLAALFLQGVRVRLDDLREHSFDLTITAKALKRVNEALASVQRWKSRADYTMSLVEVRNRGAEIARQIIDRAAQQARDDRHDEAITTAQVAEGLASATDAIRASKLIESCKSAIASRDDRKAQDEAWARIQALVDKHEAIDAWVALARFEKRFPKSAHGSEIIAFRQRFDPEIRRQIPALLKQCDEYADGKRVAEYRRTVNLLESFSLPSTTPGLEKHRRRLAELDREIESQFASIPTRMYSRPEVVAVLEELAAVLAMNPNHPAALARRNEAWEKARPYAETMLGAAESTAKQRRLPDEQRASQIRSLRLLLKLCPPGPKYDRARELLDKFEDMTQHSG
jgi:predicted RNA-binding Zn-ribbon protein involved in translation (DUF1610 family)